MANIVANPAAVPEQATPTEAAPEQATPTETGPEQVKLEEFKVTPPPPTEAAPEQVTSPDSRQALRGAREALTQALHRIEEAEQKANG